MRHSLHYIQQFYFFCFNTLVNPPAKHLDTPAAIQAWKH
jgi:hypothetical protein